jgi:hypothetical protein
MFYLLLLYNEGDQESVISVSAYYKTPSNILVIIAITSSCILIAAIIAVLIRYRRVRNQNNQNIVENPNIDLTIPPELLTNFIVEVTIRSEL